MKIASFVINRMMPFWMIVAATLAYNSPSVFRPMAPYTVYYLGGVILMMSLTLTVGTVVKVFTRPKALIAGFVIKWTTVPLAAIIAAHFVFASQPQLAAGFILDGSTPAGVSSNLFTFLGHGAVALAVSLTFVHTMLSPLLTPAFTAAFAGKYVAVNFLGLMKQMAELVLLPVGLGLSIRYFVGAKKLQAVEPVLPMISAILLYCVDLGLVSSAAPTIAKNLHWVPIIGLTTTALCLINLAVAYFLARVLRLDRAAARAIMFDVGVYNSGLGAVLAGVNFGPFAALPALMNSVMNMTVGSMLAAYLHGHPIPRDDQQELSYTTPASSETRPGVVTGR